MKKILGVIAMLVAMLPFAVRAEVTPVSYEKYNVGDIVNFYRNQEEKNRGIEASGTETIVIQDAGASSKYVKVLMVSASYGNDGSGTTYKPGRLFQNDSDTKIIGSTYWRDFKTNKMRDYDTNAMGAIDDTDSAYSLNYISVNELKALTTVDASGNISDKQLPMPDGTKVSLFDMFTRVAYDEDEGIRPVGKNGFFTSTIEGDQVYVVAFTMTGNKVTGAKLEKVSTTQSPKPYAVVVTGFFDKTFDCHYAPACYVCGTEYKWVNKGTQDDTCTLVPNVTTVEDCVPQSCYLCNNEYVWAKDGKQDPTCTKVDTISKEADCRKNPKTGVESHILEFAIVAALCAIALLVVKRKDLFRTI